MISPKKPVALLVKLEETQNVPAGLKMLSLSVSLTLGLLLEAVDKFLNKQLKNLTLSLKYVPTDFEISEFFSETFRSIEFLVVSKIENLFPPLKVSHLYRVGVKVPRTF